jgi:hypothetical protein
MSESPQPATGSEEGRPPVCRDGWADPGLERLDALARLPCLSEQSRRLILRALHALLEAKRISGGGK